MGQAKRKQNNFIFLLPLLLTMANESDELTDGLSKGD